MLTTQRKQMLLARLAAEGRLVAKDLAAEFDTSEDTIRRDLRELAAAGRLQRVHGGALPASAALADLHGRESVSVDDKIALGRHGAGLVEDGMVVILDGGTTALQVARALRPGLRATVVTHSPTVAVEAARHPQIEILMLGGRLFRHSMVNVGAAVIEAASRLRADLYFMGVTGIHPETGLTTGDAEEAAVKLALHRRAAETVVLGSGEKLMAASPFLVAPLGEIARLVVPAATPAKTLRALKAVTRVERCKER